MYATVQGVFCFNTQPPEGGWLFLAFRRLTKSGFNTQPPEGGWLSRQRIGQLYNCFNTQPPEGGWHLGVQPFAVYPLVSTHSRLKAAGSH